MLVHILALVSALAPPSSAVNRRALLTNAAAAATVSAVPFAANAGGVSETEFIKDIVGAAGGYKNNPEGDAAIYTPKARIDGAGSKSSLILMKMPDPGPLSNRDYVDVMFFRDSAGKVLAAQQYRSTGKSYTEPVDGIQGKAIEPKFLARVEAGTGDVFPCVHCASGAVWEGKPVKVK